MAERPFLSIVVPAYNEEAVIGGFIESVRADVDRPGLTWEAVIVDDGSADQTARVVREAAGADDRIRLVEAPHRGKGAAVRQGFLAARSVDPYGGRGPLDAMGQPLAVSRRRGAGRCAADCHRIARSAGRGTGR